MTTFGLSDSSDDELDQPLDGQQPDVLANANASIKRCYDGVKSSILEICYVKHFTAWISSPRYPAPQLKNTLLALWRAHFARKGTDAPCVGQTIEECAGYRSPKAIGKIVHDWDLAKKMLPEGLSLVYDLEIYTILIYTIEYGLWQARQNIDFSQRPQVDEFERRKSLIAQEMSKIKGLHYHIPSDVVKPKLFGVLSTLMFDDY
ncbi:hypothetical protein KEM56_006631 [Ascosphaera pollenicola]|nr:hypothetical protein KEM56_006631 [Ascosphaera pollenicola]